MSIKHLEMDYKVSQGFFLVEKEEEHDFIRFFPSINGTFGSNLYFYSFSRVHSLFKIRALILLNYKERFGN